MDTKSPTTATAQRYATSTPFGKTKKCKRGGFRGTCWRAQVASRARTLDASKLWRVRLPDLRNAVKACRLVAFLPLEAVVELSPCVRLRLLCES